MAFISLDFTGVGLEISSGPVHDLRAVGPTPLHGRQQFIATELLYCERSLVLRGVIKSLDPSLNDYAEIGVVCKYREDDISSLGHEADVYRGDLRELQGVAVPRFYGLFEGSYGVGAGKETRIACIILEYCASDRDGSVWNVDTREAVARTMLQIHKAGVVQRDFEDANVLVSESDEVRIVDFDQATHHDCRGDLEIEVWGYEPPRYDYGCDEMYYVMKTLALWTPVLVPFSGSYFYIFNFPDPKSLADSYLRHHPHSGDPGIQAAVRKEAEEALSAYYKKYGERFEYIGDPRDIEEEEEVDEDRAQRAAED